MTIIELLKDWQEYYGETTEKTILEVNKYLKKIDKNKLHEVDVAVKENHHQRFGYPCIASIHSAIKNYEKEYNIGLRQTVDYYHNNMPEEKPVIEELKDEKGETVKFINYLKEIIKN